MQITRKVVSLLAVITGTIGGIIFVVGSGYFENRVGYFSQTSNRFFTMKQGAMKSPSQHQPPPTQVVTRYESPKLDALTKALVFIMNLQSFEAKVYSQNKEDGVVEAIFRQIGIKHKYYVEFGVESGVQCITRIFREKKYGWKGLLMDGGFSNPAINLHKEMIFPSNIVQLFKKYNVPKVFDLLSVDTDFKDLWILRNILSAGYRPRVIVGEYNTFLGPKEGLTIPINSNQTRWDGRTRYFGYSATAGWHLSRSFGYSMVYCESVGVNCFYVIDGAEGFGTGVRISDYVNGSSLWRGSCCLGHAVDVKKRPYTKITADTKFH